MGNANNPQMVGFNSPTEMGSLEGKSIMEDESLSGAVSSDRNSSSLKGEKYSRKCTWSIVITSIKIVFFSDKINLLIPCGPLAMVVHKLTSHHDWVFFLSLLGIIPLAERLGWATEQLAFYTGPTAGGLLNATFGNATELIISMYAMKHGMLRVVQQSLLGSILSNMLLVLGCAFFSGGIVHRNKEQVFNKANAVMSSGLLLMAVMGLLLPAVLHFTHTELHFGTSELALSRFSSCVMLVAYGAYLFFQLTSYKNSYSPITEDSSPDDESLVDEESPDISMYESIILLSLLTLVISVLSKYLVDTIEGASVALNVPVSFISVILLPIVGNAAEHAGAIMFAVKDKLVNSCSQVNSYRHLFRSRDWFLDPNIHVWYSVLCGCWVDHWTPMDLNFQLFETATLFMTVLVVAFMLQEGTSNYFKGLMLLFCYLIVAASFFVHIDPQSIQDKP